MSKWIWLEREVIVAIHDSQLAEHGGIAGLRDETLFDSAVGRPPNLAAYGKPDAAALAASYGYGLSRNHPFLDGNKRTAYVAAELFLALNGYDLLADDAACVVTMLNVAAGNITEEAFAEWLRQNSERVA